MNRPAALAVVAVAGVAALAVGVGGWSSGGTRHQEQTFDQKITEVRLDTGGGDVEIAAGGVDKIEVKQSYRSFSIFKGKPKKIEVDGETLVLPDGNCGWNCSVNFTVRVPEGTKITGQTHSGTVSLTDVASVDLEVDSGDVDIANVAGAVNVRSQSGTVDVQQARGDVNIHSQSGDISADDVNGKSEFRANSGTVNADNLRGAVDAETSSGDISVNLAVPASVRAQASSGSVDLRVPEAAYKVRTDTSSGEADAQVQSDPNSSFTLDATTSSGDITIERD
ncbi:DUF4097 family beta strand repeat-containing protein [Tenggerimyces flavus]|uniref:DUF4097 domain-containing protein n=1 Tax=Tenggerimyces flavus TaxID=1708749 RepID=A0ABV7Y5F1_9ACTN|nr:DUF4097 family beta strand repeat-containing protein [Tenggerimyces flavus]MBM7788612.1 DUF4097 and DUF4098 domain-containing protein YvlB [Tenggerimyces flavus]